MQIKFGEWAPDQSNIAGSLRVADNVLYSGGSYIPFRGEEKQGNVITGTPLHAASLLNSEGAALTFVGTTTNLYLSIGDGTYTDVGQTYNISREDGWSFIGFGDYVIAAGGSTTQIYKNGAFEDLTGAPNAGVVGMVKDFVVLGDLEGDPSKIHWSGINDAEAWTVGANQSDTQLFPDGGKIQAIVSCETGYVFQRRGISSMTYEGPPFIFRFRKISDKRGALTKHSVAYEGKNTFFLSDDGFFSLQGEQHVPIGEGRVDEYFKNTERVAYRHKIRSTVIPNRQVAIWIYVSTATGTGEPDTALVYDYGENKWTRLGINMRSLFNYVKNPLNTDTMDTDYPDLDAIDISFDNALFKGGDFELGGITDDNYLCTFEGPAMEATFESTVFRIGEQGTHVSRVRDTSDASNTNIAVRGGVAIDQMGAYTTYGTRNRDGYASRRSHGQYQQVKLNIPADGALQDTDNRASWSEVDGVEVVLAGRGMR